MARPRGPCRPLHRCGELGRVFETPPPLGLASAAFFPWFLLLIWGFVIGGWLLVARQGMSVERT
jgi:hypothetical protein